MQITFPMARSKWKTVRPKLSYVATSMHNIASANNAQNPQNDFILSPHFRILLLVLVPFHVQNRLHKYVEAFPAQMHVLLPVVYAQGVIVSLFATAVCVHGLATSIALYRIAHSVTSLFSLCALGM